MIQGVKYFKQRKSNYPQYETTKFRDIREMIENVAEKYPNRTALSYKKNPDDAETICITYAQARSDVCALGTALISAGCRDTKAAIIGGNSIGWAYAYFAVLAIGAVAVPIDKKLPIADLIGIVSKTKAETVFYSSDIADAVATIRKECPSVKRCICIEGTPSEGDPSIDNLINEGVRLIRSGDNSYYDYEIDPDKLAIIVFTSGTTGRGKGVMLSQTNICSDMTQGMYNFEIGEKTINVLPLHHTFGSTVNLVGHFAQGSEVYISSGIRFLSRELKEQSPNHLILVPLFLETLFKRIWATAEKEGRAKLLRSTIKFSETLRRAGIDRRKQLFQSIRASFGGKLTLIICGGAHLAQEIIDFFDAIGITVLNGYGITECSPLISANRNEYRKPGSVGTPIVGELVKIRNPDENGEGEICVKGPNVMLGYYEDPEATAAAFDEEGYFRTGDYGRLDDEGWLYITGRLKNLIIFSNGKNVYPEEIEAEIYKIYGVAETVVYAGESRLQPGREVIVAEIYPDYEALMARGITDAQTYFNEKIKEVNARMISYKNVGLVKIRDTEFPKNTSSKITRFNINKSID